MLYILDQKYFKKQYNLFREVMEISPLPQTMEVYIKHKKFYLQREIATENFEYREK